MQHRWGEGTMSRSTRLIAGPRSRVGPRSVAGPLRSRCVTAQTSRYEGGLTPRCVDALTSHCAGTLTRVRIWPARALLAAGQAQDVLQTVMPRQPRHITCARIAHLRV